MRSPIGLESVAGLQSKVPHASLSLAMPTSLLRGTSITPDGADLLVSASDVLGPISELSENNETLSRDELDDSITKRWRLAQTRPLTCIGRTLAARLRPAATRI